jgi:hypothetical protein
MLTPMIFVIAALFIYFKPVFQTSILSTNSPCTSVNLKYLP